MAIRGDLAHIALAKRYLCAHYVVPHVRTIGPEGAALRCQPREDSEEVTRLAAGTSFEALDYAGKWCWGCLSPEGPSGYLHLTELVAED